jgi:hypothetical protein
VIYEVKNAIIKNLSRRRRVHNHGKLLKMFVILNDNLLHVIGAENEKMLPYATGRKRSETSNKNNGRTADKIKKSYGERNIKIGQQNA